MNFTVFAQSLSSWNDGIVPTKIGETVTIDEAIAMARTDCIRFRPGIFAHVVRNPDIFESKNCLVFDIGEFFAYAKYVSTKDEDEFYTNVSFSNPTTDIDVRWGILWDAENATLYWIERKVTIAVTVVAVATVATVHTKSNADLVFENMTKAASLATEAMFNKLPRLTCVRVGAGSDTGSSVDGFMTALTFDVASREDLPSKSKIWIDNAEKTCPGAFVVRFAL